MYKIIPYLAFFCLWFISCNRTSKEIVSSKSEHKNEPVEAAKDNSKPSSTYESYDQFYKKFHRDSLFQMSRINFPIKGHTYDSLGEFVPWTKENWSMHRSEITSVDTAIYKMDTAEAKDWHQEILYIEGSGFRTERQFKRVNGKWFLIYYADDNF